MGIAELEGAFADMGVETLDDVYLVDEYGFGELEKAKDSLALQRIKLKKLAANLQSLQEIVNQFNREPFVWAVAYANTKP